MPSRTPPESLPFRRHLAHCSCCRDGPLGSARAGRRRDRRNPAEDAGRGFKGNGQRTHGRRRRSSTPVPFRFRKSSPVPACRNQARRRSRKSRRGSSRTSLRTLGSADKQKPARTNARAGLGRPQLSDRFDQFCGILVSDFVSVYPYRNGRMKIKKPAPSAPRAGPAPRIFGGKGVRTKPA